MDTITLNAKNKNTLAFTYPADLTGLQVIFRAKKNKENATNPLIELLATIDSATQALSSGYFNIDLSVPGLSELGGAYFCEFEINNGATINDPGTAAPTFFDITQLQIIERLDN